MAHNHESFSGHSGNHLTSSYERLTPHVPYTIDTDVPPNVRAEKSAFTSATIHAGPITDPASLGQGERGDTYTIINTSQLLRRAVIEEDGKRLDYRIYNRIFIPADAEFLLLGPNFDESHHNVGWMPVRDGQTITVGREDPDTRNIFPMSPEVSRNHFSLHYHDGSLTITDNGSSNGTHMWTPHLPQTTALDSFIGNQLGSDTKNVIIDMVNEMDGNRREVIKKFHPDVQPDAADPRHARRNGLIFDAAMHLLEQSNNAKRR